TRLLAPLHRAMAAAATLTGKRFGLLVASSVVATSVIVASAMTATNGTGPLAALLGRSLAADNAPAVSEPEAEETAPESPSPDRSQPSSPAPASSSVTPAPVSEPGPQPEPQPEPEPEQATPEEPAPELGPVKHVFVVSVASPGYEAAFGTASQMPYLSGTLRPQGVLLTNFMLLSQAALPNSLAAISGQPPNPATDQECPTYDEFPATARVSRKGVVAGSGCVYPVTTLSLADQLGSARLSWRAYMEGMIDEAGRPANCVHPEPGAAETPPPGGYSSKLNPFAYFHSLLDLGDCAANDVPLSSLEKDLRRVETTASYTYVAPTPCNAGFAGTCAPGAAEGPAAADAFLAQWVPKVLSSPAYKQDGLLIVTFGGLSPPAGAGASGEAPAPVSLRTGTLLVSNFLSPGATDGAAYDPYSLLRSSEEIFGLPTLAEAGRAKVRTFSPALSASNGGD
ncbi:MAG: alkaline phosphatase family protein, partial [Syntrophothermus sp.]